MKKIQKITGDEIEENENIRETDKYKCNNCTPWQIGKHTIRTIRKSAIKEKEN